MKFGYSNHQIVKMLDWVWSSGPDLAPLSRNRVNNIQQYLATFNIEQEVLQNKRESFVKYNRKS